MTKRKVLYPGAGFWLWGLAVIVLAIPLWMAVDLLAAGWGSFHAGFLFGEPLDAGRGGGIGSLLVSTLWILAVCLLVMWPVGLCCALFISESVWARGRTGRMVGMALDVLSAVPSIVYGLFGYVFFCQVLGLGFSILSGGLTLACMALPLFVRLTEQAFRGCPARYRQAAMALNLSHSGFCWRVLLPVSAGGIAAATIIAIGRALAETAVLLFTAGYVTRYPESVFDSGRSLSVHIYDLAMNVAGGTGPAAATAIILMGLLILINTMARFLGRRCAADHG